MELNWSYILVAATILIYLVAAFIQFRRVILMRMRVNHLASKGKRVVGKIISYARTKHIELEFTNQSNSKVITDFRIDNVDNKLPVGSDVTVLLGSNPKNSPAIVLEYNKKLISPNIAKYAIFGTILVIIAALLFCVLNFTEIQLASSYIGLLIPLIAAIAIFIAVTEDEMAQNRTNNLLLLFGHNATAKIRKASSTGIVKKGCKEMSFFLEFKDENGSTLYCKTEEAIEQKDYQHFKNEKKVDILYSTESRKSRCLLNYAWQ